MSDILEIAGDGAIAVLTPNRPGKHNAMSDALLAEVDAARARHPVPRTGAPMPSTAHSRGG